MAAGYSQHVRERKGSHLFKEPANAANVISSFRKWKQPSSRVPSGSLCFSSTWKVQFVLCSSDVPSGPGLPVFKGRTY